MSSSKRRRNANDLLANAEKTELFRALSAGIGVKFANSSGGNSDAGNNSRNAHLFRQMMHGSGGGGRVNGEQDEDDYVESSGDMLMSTFDPVLERVATNDDDDDEGGDEKKESRTGAISRFLPVRDLDFFGDMKEAVVVEEEEEMEEEEEDQKSCGSDEEMDSDVDDDSENEEDDEDSLISRLTRVEYTKRTEEQIRHVRQEYRIYIKGVDCPNPIVSFGELAKRPFAMNSALLKNIATGHKFTEPTPVQMQTIPILTRGREVLVSASTGSGKTMAFAVPILHSLKTPAEEGFRALVITPTKVLAEQIYSDMLILGDGMGWQIRCVDRQTDNDEALRSKRNDVLITTPTWLVRMIQDKIIDVSNVQRLVLDEADRLFEMGFMQQIDEIITACSHPKIVRCLFSATIPSGVEQMADTFLNDPIRVIIGLRNAAAETVHQKLEFCGNDAGKLLAVRMLFKQGVDPPVLIFVKSASRAEELYKQLMLEGISIDYIHAKRSDDQNREVVRNFRLGKMWVLICTDVMARGLDFKGVSTVINYDFPSNVISYIHRIGRTGRAGKRGEAVTYFSYEDMQNLKEIAEVVRRSGFDVPDWMLTARPMTKTEFRNKRRRRHAVKNNRQVNDGEGGRGRGGQQGRKKAKDMGKSKKNDNKKSQGKARIEKQAKMSRKSRSSNAAKKTK